MDLFCWDLDRTYLDTDIHSVRGMIRSAIEPASAKRAIPGAAALLRGLTSRAEDAHVAILSGSPTQMRDVIEEKLALDGIRFDQLVLKDNLGNLRRGRFRALRGQLGYKLPQLLRMYAELGQLDRAVLFGDDSEVDALVYMTFGEIAAGRLEPATITRLLELGGAYPDQIHDTLRHIHANPPADILHRAFIHVDQGVPMNTFRLLGPKIVAVFSWFQAALLLARDGLISHRSLRRTLDACEHLDHISPEGAASLVQDLVRRGLITADDAMEVARLAIPHRLGAIQRAVSYLGPLEEHPTGAPDLFGFLRTVQAE